MSGQYRSGHLGEFLEEYVDGALSDTSSARAAAHLVACEQCRGDVQAERAIVKRLRTVTVDPTRHADLMADLLAMPPLDVEASGSRPGLEVGPHVALISPLAPPQYNRRRRAQLLGASILAVGALGVLSALSASPQRTAPGDAPLAHGRSASLSDDVVAYSVREDEAPQSHRGG